MSRSLTYAEMAEALKITPASANKLARRKRWPRVPGNDGKARVSVPEDALVRRDSPQDNLIKALEAHVETLKAQLSAAEARINKQADDLIAYDTAYAAGLAAERAKVEAERAKAERVIAEFAARDAQHAAELKTEQAQTEKAIAAFSALAERLDQLAAERARPWWRRRLLRRAG
jgi:DNA repair exonuclease SbcCD ATPase subunit